MRISDWSSDVCSSDLNPGAVHLMPLALIALFVVRGLSDFAHVTAMNSAASKLVLDLRRAMFDRLLEFGRASCRERVCQYGSISVSAVSLKKTKYRLTYSHWNFNLVNFHHT